MWRRLRPPRAADLDGAVPEQVEQPALQNAHTADVEDTESLDKEDLLRRLTEAEEQRDAAWEEAHKLAAQLQQLRGDLMGRLNNAVAQRNAAREEALMLEAKLKQLQDDMQAGRLAPVTADGMAAKGAAASVGMATPPRAAAAADEEGMMDRKRRFMQQIPGTSPMGAPLTPPPGRLEGPATEPPSEMDRRQRELYARQQQLPREQRTADQEKLLAAIGGNLGFHQGRPVAASTIFRCCLQWRTFQADRTPLFDRIIATMGSQVELHQEDYATLAYWLSNTVTLLYLMQKNVKPASGGGYAARIKASGQLVTRGLFGSSKGSFTSFFTRTGYDGGSPGQGMQASIHGDAMGGFRQVEAKHPALLFKQQLDAFVQKIYPMLRDDVKKEISPQLAACIHAPRQGARITIEAAASANGKQPGNLGEVAGALSPHWAIMLRVLDSLLATLRENYVPPFLVQKLFEQLLAFVNVQLFNQLLLRRKCCSFSNSEYVRAGLSVLEQWIFVAGEEWVGESWAALAHIRQAADFLVAPQKQRMSFHEVTEELCGSLSVQQLYRISTMYWDDRYNTETVSPEVLAQLKAAMQESSSSASSHSFLFLLEDDSAIPFTHADVERMGDDKDLLGEMPVPKQLQGEPSFSFLRKPLELALQGADLMDRQQNAVVQRNAPCVEPIRPEAKLTQLQCEQSAAARIAPAAAADSPAAAAGLAVQRAEAIEALKLAAVQQRLPMVPVPLGPAGTSLSIPLSSWLLCESLICWAGVWQPGEIVTATDALQRAIVDAADGGGLRGQAYWLACSLAAGGLLKFRTVGRREYSHLLRLSDALINCTPVHEALGDSIADALPVSVAVLLSDEAKRVARRRRHSPVSPGPDDSPGSGGGHAAQSPWRALLGGMSNVLEALRAEGVPAPAVRAVAWACLRYIDAELLNALLLRRDCCSVSAAKALQAGLAELRGWVAYVGGECCSPEEAEVAIERITQAARFLVQGKDECIRKTFRGMDIVADLARSCPALSLQQVYRLSEHQHDDWLGSEGASGRESTALLETLKRLMAEQRARMGASGAGSGAADDEDEEDLLVEPHEAFVLPWRVLTEAARCFVQVPAAPARGSAPVRVPDAAAAVSHTTQPAMSTLVLLDAIGQACINAELPSELRSHPEFAFLQRTVE